MSGPYCETCDFYSPMPFGNEGECNDSSKIIYVGKGGPVNSPPAVHPAWECGNHTGLAADVNQQRDRLAEALRAIRDAPGGGPGRRIAAQALAELEGEK